MVQRAVLPHKRLRMLHDPLQSTTMGAIKSTTLKGMLGRPIHSCRGARDPATTAVSQATSSQSARTRLLPCQGSGPTSPRPMRSSTPPHHTRPSCQWSMATQAGVACANTRMAVVVAVAAHARTRTTRELPLGLGHKALKGMSMLPRSAG